MAGLATEFRPAQTAQRRPQGFPHPTELQETLHEHVARDRDQIIDALVGSPDKALNKAAYTMATCARRRTCTSTPTARKVEPFLHRMQAPPLPLLRKARQPTSPTRSKRHSEPSARPGTWS